MYGTCQFLTSGDLKSHALFQNEGLRLCDEKGSKPKCRIATDSIPQTQDGFRFRILPKPYNRNRREQAYREKGYPNRGHKKSINQGC